MSNIYLSVCVLNEDRLLERAMDSEMGYGHWVETQWDWSGIIYISTISRFAKDLRDIGRFKIFVNLVL